MTVFQKSDICYRWLFALEIFFLSFFFVCSKEFQAGEDGITGFFLQRFVVTTLIISRSPERDTSLKFGRRN